MDGYDFQAVSLSLPSLAIHFNKPRDDIAIAITLTLLFRPVGAIIFGIAGDLYGRKWPMVANLIMIFCIEIGTVNTKNFTQFLIVCSQLELKRLKQYSHSRQVRSLFGIGMGGVWGNAASMALESTSFCILLLTPSVLKIH